MGLKLNTASGSVTIVGEDGSGNANVTIPRAGVGTVSNLSDLSITATSTELNYVSGVTSSIQTQLDSKGTVSSLSDLSITSTATELNYVSGVTSPIQTQLDNAASTGKSIAMSIVFG